MCPACENLGVLLFEPWLSSDPVIDQTTKEIVSTKTYVPTHFHCTDCELNLWGMSMLKEAKMDKLKEFLQTPDLFEIFNIGPAEIRERFTADQLLTRQESDDIASAQAERDHWDDLAYDMSRDDRFE